MLSEDRSLGVDDLGSKWTAWTEVEPSVSLAQLALLSGRRQWDQVAFQADLVPASFLASLMENFSPLSNISLNFQ